MNLDTFVAAMRPGDVSRARYAELLPGFEAAMILADITTEDRAAMWCAQLGHESLGLSAMEEFASGAAYEGRTSLGNTQPGDGVRFKGRGPIQVTGRHNYTLLSAWAYGRGEVPSATYFVDHPTELAEPRYGFLGAVWYWTTQRRLNALSDARDLVGATKAINGGTTGIDDRRARYDRCRALGSALLPTGDDNMADDKALDIREQLTGSREIGKYPGWAQLGDKAETGVERRTLVDGVARTIQQLNFAIAQNDRIEKAQARIEAKLDKLLGGK